VDEGALTHAEVARRALNGATAAPIEHPVDAGDDGSDLLAGEVEGGQPRVDALDEEALCGIHRADTGEIALVEQSLADRDPTGGDPRRGDFRVPIRAKNIGTKVADEIALSIRGDEVEHPQPQAEGRPAVGDEKGADLVVACLCCREVTRSLDSPLTLHPQVGVQGDAGAQPMEEVFAPRHHAEGRRTAQIGVDEGAPAQLGTRQRDTTHGFV